MSANYPASVLQAKMMHMTFYWGKDVTILFDWWRTKTWTGYCLSLLAVFVVAAFYQYLEDRRVAIKIGSLRKTSPPSSSQQASLQSPFLLSPLRYHRQGVARVVVAGMFGVNAAVGYLLMLAVMSFNGGVFVAAVLGLMFGYFAFRSGGEEDIVPVENPCACA